MTHAPEFVRVEGMASGPRMAEALRGKNPDPEAIANARLELTDLVLAKNHDYGSSIWKPPLLCPHVPVDDAQLVMMSQKVQRLINLVGKEILVDDESRANTLRDLGAYCILLAIYLDRQKVREREQ